MYGEEIPYDEIERYDQDRRRAIWEAASGLQSVDGLTTSDFANHVAGGYIEGEYDADEAVRRIEGHYDAGDGRQREADVVAARINAMVASAKGTSIRLEPSTLKRIHASLFKDVLDDRRWVGEWRAVNISKREPVLGGRSVRYADYHEIVATLEYDLAQESTRTHDPLSDTGEVHRVSEFISRLWETHPFREGNTRTTATFAHLYLNSLGADVRNEEFRDNSRFFRDALVRSNFSDLALGITADRRFLDRFFENLVLGASHDLDSMDLNIHGIRIDPDLPYRAPERRSRKIGR